MHISIFTDVPTACRAACRANIGNEGVAGSGIRGEEPSIIRDPGAEIQPGGRGIVSLFWQH